MTRTDIQMRRIPKRFYFLTALVFLPVFFCMTVIGAKWYGFAVTSLAFALLMFMRGLPLWDGWRVPVFFVLALAVAFSGLYFSRPRTDVSLPGQIGSGIVRTFTHLPVDEDIRSGRSFGKASLWKPSEGFAHEIIELERFDMEVNFDRESESEWAVLQLHGGAFAAGMNDLYRAMGEKYCAIAGGAAVFTPDYRLFPAHAYPSQQNDTMDAWRYIVDKLGYKPGNIIVAGDSAGGTLALNLGLRLRDSGEELPAAFICMSPWADLSNSGASHVYNAVIDPSFGVNEADYDGKTPVGVQSAYADGLNAQTPYLSPSFGDYSGFPPMLLQAGELEILLSDSEMVLDNALENGVDCTLTVYPGMFHVFQGSLEFLPESREAWEEIKEFIGKAMRQSVNASDNKHN